MCPATNWQKEERILALVSREKEEAVSFPSRPFGAHSLHSRPVRGNKAASDCEPEGPGPTAQWGPAEQMRARPGTSVTIQLVGVAVITLQDKMETESVSRSKWTSCSSQNRHLPVPGDVLLGSE